MAGTVAGKSIVDQLEARTSLMSTPEVASLLNEDITTIRKRVKQGTIPHLRIGVRIKFDPAELAVWMRESRKGPLHK